MNNQFATQFLLSEIDEYDSLRGIFKQLGAEDDTISVLLKAIRLKALTPQEAIDILKKVRLGETSAVGGGVTGGPTAATATPGTGEQVAGTKKAFKEKYQENQGSNEPMYVDWDEYTHPNYLVITLKDGSKLKISEKNTVKGGKKTYQAIAQAFQDERYDITNKVVAAMLQNTSKDVPKKEQLEDEEDEKLEVDDRVLVTYGNKFEGEKGTVVRVSPYSGFIEVEMDIDGGVYSMSGSDVKKIEDDDDDYDDDDDSYLDEDAPRLAGSPAKTNKQGSRNLNAYSSVGFTKAPNAQEAGKKMKSIGVKMLWKEGEEPAWEGQVEPLAKALADRNIPRNLHAEFFDYLKEKLAQKELKQPQDVFDAAHHFLEMLRETLNESRAYAQFKKEAAVRTKNQQMHEAAKMIHNRLAEVYKLLEYAQQMREELYEGEQSLEYNNNTKKVFERISAKVLEVYSKLKKLK